MLGQAMRKTLHFTKAADRFKKREDRERKKNSWKTKRGNSCVFVKALTKIVVTFAFPFSNVVEVVHSNILYHNRSQLFDFNTFVLLKKCAKYVYL